MMKFMFIAAPRSGTAWAANWLTTDRRLCLHDPLWDTHYEDFDALARGFPTRLVGVACTGLAYWPDWLNAHTARKVILHRAPDEVNRSLTRQGLSHCPPVVFENLERVRGLHVEWRALFKDPKPLHEYLFPDEEFDFDRHRILQGLAVTAMYENRKQNPAVWKRLEKDVYAAFGRSEQPA